MSDQESKSVNRTPKQAADIIRGTGWGFLLTHIKSTEGTEHDTTTAPVLKSQSTSPIAESPSQGV